MYAVQLDQVPFARGWPITPGSSGQIMSVGGGVSQLVGCHNPSHLVGLGVGLGTGSRSLPGGLQDP